MLALSIRQPYAELILRGIKTVEYRTRPTRIIGERFYLREQSQGGQADLVG
jgi:predicted transcriptional regulator